MSYTILKDLESIHHFPHTAFYRKEYLSSQEYNELVIGENDKFFIPFSMEGNLARSIPRSPFGSFYMKENIETGDAFHEFHQSIVKELKERNIDRIEITRPSPIYNSFVSETEYGAYETTFIDINQHISLNDQWEDRIHKMQSRKLVSLKNEGFEFRKMDNSKLETAYQFLKVCRQTQGLEINVSWELLRTLAEKLPNTYECFGVFREDKISALCIAVNVTDEVAYYYLPGTSPMFRSQSPMVLLIAGMINYYREKGFRYLDLGVSSIQGRPQETLRIFKERMGAEETAKPLLRLSI